MQYHYKNELNVHGYTVNEAINLFLFFYNSCAQQKKGTRLCVVHGYGSTGGAGKIRSALRKLLTDHNDKLEWHPGEQIDGNPGITYITAYQLLPETHENLASEIIQFCHTPKTREKIAGHFRKHGDQCVLKSIRYLEKNSLLTICWKGKHKCYRSSQ
ncbi:protein containing Smr protein/MutS2 [Candidatus Magnetomorum sp. HK-1]|nr:protein containing Smr protein/MutS2 [Candidatus Magnetomorum sp. HK-1]